MVLSLTCASSKMTAAGAFSPLNVLIEAKRAWYVVMQKALPVSNRSLENLLAALFVYWSPSRSHSRAVCSTKSIVLQQKNDRPDTLVD